MRDDPIDGTDHQLVKHRQGVSHGSATSAHVQFQHTRLRLDAFLVADLLKIGAHDLLRHQAERIMVGT